MPAENQTFWTDFMQAVAASSLFNLAAWGAPEYRISVDCPERLGSPMGLIDIITRELNTPTGQQGPLSAAYTRAAGGVWHSMLGAVCAASLGVWGLVPALAIGVAYWMLKERGDLRRGGGLWDGFEDALMVCLGAWYGVWWWPAMVCGAGVYILASAAWRAR